jgi:hypothetical protein
MHMATKSLKTVKPSPIVIPDLWHLYTALLKGEMKKTEQQAWADDVLATWHLCHKLRDLAENKRPYRKTRKAGAA